MALRRVKRFDQTKQFDTSGLGGQAGPSPINSAANYRATSGGGEVDEGLSPANVNPRGISSIIRKKYRITQTAQLNTTDAPRTVRDSVDINRSFNP